MRKLLTLTLLLQTVYSFAQDSTVIVPYNDVHTEGYKGNVKNVTITSYVDPVYAKDGVTIKKSKSQEVMYMNFNKSKFITSVSVYKVEKGKETLIDKQVRTYKDTKNYNIVEYGTDNTQTSTSIAYWVNDSFRIVKEYDNDGNLIQSDEEYLNKNYKTVKAVKQFLTPTGLMYAKGLMLLEYNEYDNIVKVTMDLYDMNDKASPEDHSVYRTTILKRDSLGNPTHNSTTITGAGAGTWVMYIEYEYYD